MTTSEWLQQANKTLRSANIGTAELDALVLLEDVVGQDRAHLLAHPEKTLTDAQQVKLQRYLKKRCDHIPLAYIRGKTEFYGCDFLITPAVLEPRPESETMIELLLKQTPTPACVVDVGTGSGALAITTATELVSVRVIATDIDRSCLEVARKNCKLHKATVDLKQTNLIDGLELPAGTVLLANLPYVPDDYQINTAALHEPRRAIFGGPDGLGLYRQLFAQAAAQNEPPTFIYTESLPFQHQTLATIAEKYSYQQIIEDDFIQVFSSAAQPAA